MNDIRHSLLAIIGIAAATPAVGAQTRVDISAENTTELFETQGPRRDAVLPISLIAEEGNMRARIKFSYDMVRAIDDRVFASSANLQPEQVPTLHPYIGNTTFTLSRAVPVGGTFILDLAGEIELPTAALQRWNGTGRRNMLIEANLSATAGRWSFWANTTHRFNDANARIPLKDNWDLRLGTAMMAAHATELSLEASYWQSPWRGEAQSSDLTFMVDHRAGRLGHVGAYATYGFSGEFSGVTAAVRWTLSLRR